jgi:hypothetical protein
MREKIILTLRWLRGQIDELLRLLGDEDVHTMGG